MAEVATFSSEIEEPQFDDASLLTYLGLPNGYQPRPSTEPIEFLRRHLRQLPPSLLQPLASITTPKQRTIVPTIRNRRLKFTKSDSSVFSYNEARKTWPALWKGPTSGVRPGQEEREEEKRWAESSFLEGQKQHIGKLGNLLGDFVEEREAEQARAFRRAAAQDFVPEEEEESDDSDGIDDAGNAADVEETEEEARENFERMIRERFIYGLLDVSNNLEHFAMPWRVKSFCIVSMLIMMLSIGTTGGMQIMTEKTKSAGSMRKKRAND